MSTVPQTPKHLLVSIPVSMTNSLSTQKLQKGSTLATHHPNKIHHILYWSSQEYPNVPNDRANYIVSYIMYSKYQNRPLEKGLPGWFESTSKPSPNSKPGKWCRFEIPNLNRIGFCFLIYSSQFRNLTIFWPTLFFGEPSFPVPSKQKPEKSLDSKRNRLGKGYASSREGILLVYPPPSKSHKLNQIDDCILGTGVAIYYTSSGCFYTPEN